MRKFTQEALLIATHNSGKLEEISELLANRNIKLFAMGDFDLPEPEETETTFVGNARIKAHAAAAATGHVALADDSGLCVDALHGAPGVYTADWAETPAGRDFQLAMRRVHDELDQCGAPEPWRAAFVCTLVLAWPDGHDEVFEGRIEGRIVNPGRGAHGHGYDPIFQPDGHTQTFGEMDRWQKNRLSHRGLAFQKLLACFT
ncbi:XTP/dITP diphosphohydrolase [Gemmobacter megaterium]|uniref:dITP/XTP pyrophosphatase n=1 Tax=Gemmobacter megaterium TaxID=1086013 RepID=A0A1N7PPN0_9RHOB|nr:RdgB/HAM1 family non-canonical purine NTP pyrophosphatase [Gemmobacter megaterium]GGE20466.1 non-canonical purine NTP pyrophosphatase [Gemmobacter megaterium]SIT12558.1 XTP/dITP diphosphohydrolase [Gemmobacter megaterium]